MTGVYTRMAFLPGASLGAPQIIFFSFDDTGCAEGQSPFAGSLRVSLRELFISFLGGRGGAHYTPPRRLSKYKKKGAPQNAVTIPTGNSDGLTTVRATRSAKIKNPAPTIAAIGISDR